VFLAHVQKKVRVIRRERVGRRMELELLRT